MSESASAAPAASVDASASIEASPETSSQVEGSAEGEAEEGITAEEQAELDAEEAAPAVEAAKKPDATKTKLKVDGKDVEMTHEELKKYASMGKAAQKRMQEAAETKKTHEKLQSDIQTFLEMLKTNPEKVLADMGIDPDKFAEDRLNKKIADAEKTPEQKEKEEMLAKLEKAQKELDEAKEGKRKEEQERLHNEIATKIEKDINEAIEAADMPKSPYMIRKVADLMLLATAQKVEVEAKDIIPLAKKQLMEEFRSLTSVLPEEILEEILGTDKVASLRRRYVKKMKTVPTTSKDIKPTGQNTTDESTKEKKAINAKEFFGKLGSF